MLFKKPFPVASRNLLGNKDKKRLKALLSATYAHCESEIDDVLFSRNEELTIVKVPGTRVNVYFNREGDPLFFHTDGGVSNESTGAHLFPTLYSLRRIPNLLPCFLIHSPVSKFLLKGADLMLPGIVVPVKLEAAFGTSGLVKNAAFSVRVIGNSTPFAVGRTVIDYETFRHGRGKALDLLHVFGDALWTSGVSASESVPGFSLGLITATSPPCKENVEFYPQLSTQTDDDEESVCSAGNHSDAKVERVGVFATPCTASQPPLAMCLTDSSSGVVDCGEKQQEENSKAVDDEATVLGDTVSVNEKTPASPTADYEWTSVVVDKFLEFLLLEALHTKFSDAACPLHISAVYGAMVQLAPVIAFHPGFLSYLQTQPDDVLRGNNEGIYDGLLGRMLALEVAQGYRVIPSDIKRSSHKKVAKFFQFYAKQKKVVQLKELRGGDIVITSIQRRSAFYTAYTPLTEADRKQALKTLVQRGRLAGDAASTDPVTASDQTSRRENVESTTKSATSDAAPDRIIARSLTSFPVSHYDVEEFYLPRQSSAPIFESSRIEPFVYDKYYSEAQCRDVLLAYIDKMRLRNFPNNPEQIRLDTTLRTCVLTRKMREQQTPKEAANTLMLWKDVVENFLNHLRALHVVRRKLPDGSFAPIDLSAKVREGKMQAVTVRLEKRQGNKVVTAVYGIHEFEINEKLFVEALQKSMAASATISGAGGVGKLKDKNLVITVQGSFTAAVVDLLTTKFGIPPRYVVKS